VLPPPPRLLAVGSTSTSPLLRQVARDLAALGQRNAVLQQEIDGLASVGSSGARAAQAVQQPREAGGSNAPAGVSHMLLPPTPDLSQT
jgi:hypothetical protein